MTNSNLLAGNLRGWLSPLVHLANNWISRIGVLLVTTAAIFLVFLVPTSHDVANPYVGIVAFLMLPAAFLSGLALIPLGMYLRLRKERRTGSYPAAFPSLSLRNLEFRRLLVFVGAATMVNLVIASQASYRAVTYMDSVSFCGQACHSVMHPEFAAYQNSPHSRVECVACHIGPGASWFVRSKLDGVRQVAAVAFNTYSRPIPTPVHNLRPARETCEACHWPQKFGEDRLRVIEKFADDEANTLSKTVLLVRIGGGSRRGPGIHGVHLGPGVEIRYRHSDEARQTIPWVEYRDGSGRNSAYAAAEAKPAELAKMPLRLMDCMDCHNRPTHAYELPERAVDRAMAAGDIVPTLPFVKKKSVEILKAAYRSNQEASRAIPEALAKYYRESLPQLSSGRGAEIARSGQTLARIYNRNVFPGMKVVWGTYPNNIGHTDFPGCFRCHDDQHKSSDGRTVTQDCSACHQLLAMDEAAPKILSDLGLQSNGAAQR